MKRINFKRGLALLLSGAMAFSASFSTVFAETSEPVLECDCTLKCTPADVEKEQPAVVKADCPVCSTENADLTACTGETTAFYGVETLEVGDNTITQALDFTVEGAPTKCGHTHITDEKCFTWANNTLTLNSLTLTTTDPIAMTLPNGAMVVMNGKNTVTSTAPNASSGSGIFSEGSLTFKGWGSIEVTGCPTTTDSSSGITASSITVQEGTVIATGGSFTQGNSYGISSGNITVTAGTINAIGGSSTQGNSYGISSGNITVTGGTVIAIGGSDNSYGVSTESLTLTGGNFTTSGTTVGLSSINSATITGGTLVATGNKAIDKAPNIDDYTNVYIAASINISGLPSTSYAGTGIGSYKYLIIGKCPPIKETLDFTNASEGFNCTDADIGHIHDNTTDRCFLWDKAKKTLILNDLNLASDSEKPILLPADTKIEMNGESQILNNYDGESSNYGIYGEGGLTFTGNGKLNVSSAYSSSADSIGIAASSVSIEAGTITVFGNSAGSNSSYAVYTTGSINVKNTGTLNAHGNRGKLSSGIYAQSVNVSGNGTLNAGGGSAEESYGIRGSDNSSIHVSDNGTLNAGGGNAKESYGIYGSGTSSIHVSGNGTLNANSSTATGVLSYGILVVSLTLEGGNLIATSGEATSSTGLACALLDITSGTLEAKGHTRAMNRALEIASSYTDAKITASKNVDGSSPETYDEKNIASYKYLKVEKDSPVTPVAPSTGGGYTPAPAQKPSITKTEGIGKEGTRFMQGKKPMTGFVEYEGKTYFADENGYAVKSDWVLVDGKWYHMNVKGEMQTGWNKISGKWYLMEKSGAMVTGWNLHNYEWYFMSSSGDMKTGWVKSGNNWYYMSGNGAMTSGKWIQTNGKWYYLRADGTMAANTKIGSYAVDSSGAWVK